MPDSLVRCLAPGGAARVVAAVTTGAARGAAARHGARGAAAAVLGESATAALLLATLTKGGERVTLQLTGDGPVGAVVADANDAGDVRAYVRRPDATVGGIGARGLVAVVRELGLKDNYRGQAPLAGARVDESVEHYLETSEQIASALACHAGLDDAGALVAAAGVLVQCLPGGDTAAVDAARRALREGAVLRWLAAGGGQAAALAEAVVPGAQVLDERPVRFHCGCSEDRVLGALALFGADELDAMIREDGRAEVVCHFCHRRYPVARERLETLKESLTAGGLTVKIRGHESN